MKNDWPFNDPRNVAVFTTAEVMNKSKPILYVSHDADDGAWQFHAGGQPDMNEAKILSLESITRIDPTIFELADLPEGWVAEREECKAKWRRRKK